MPPWWPASMPSMAWPCWSTRPSSAIWRTTGTSNETMAVLHRPVPVRTRRRRVCVRIFTRVALRHGQLAPDVSQLVFLPCHFTWQVEDVKRGFTQKGEIFHGGSNAQNLRGNRRARDGQAGSSRNHIVAREGSEIRAPVDSPSY